MKINALRINSDDNVDFLKQVNIKPGDVLLIELNHVEMPPSSFRKYAEDVKKAFVECFPDNKCLVVPKGNMNVSFISPMDAVQVKLATPDAI